MSFAVKQNYIYAFLLVLSAFGSMKIYKFTHQDWILYREAETLYNKKEFSEAAVLYVKSLQAGFPRSRMSPNLANSYVALGKFDEAITFYREYLSHYPGDTHTRLEFAKTLSWTGNKEEAEKEYQKILEEK